VVDRCKQVIDTVAQDGGYIMDASALIMNDAIIENVQVMIDFTLDYGTYSQSGSPSRSLEEIKNVSRPEPTGIQYPEQKRKPGVCIPWEEKRQELPEFQGDEAAARKVWGDVDGMGYGYCWVNLTW
jgi:hypothetical protein